MSFHQLQMGRRAEYTRRGGGTRARAGQGSGGQQHQSCVV